MTYSISSKNLKISEIEHIEQYDGFGLYDQSFIKILRELNDSIPVQNLDKQAK